MEYKEFILKVKMAVEEELGKDYEVKLQQVLKNNGSLLDGLSICKCKENCAPVIYLNAYYEQFKREMPFNEIVMDIVEVFTENQDMTSGIAQAFTSFEEMKDRVVYNLIRAETNTELLKDIPHVRFLDMAVVFYLLLDRNEKGRMTALIHNNHLECCKITGDELYQIAKVNTPKLFPAKIQTLGQVLLEICKVQFGDSLNPDMIEELSEEEDTASSFYVLSNGDGVKGAGCILYEGCLRKLAEQQHSDLIILPSSIHEVLLVCDRGEMNYQELNEMVKCINKENVPMEDVLSDRIYRYSCADDKISLIDTL